MISEQMSLLYLFETDKSAKQIYKLRFKILYYEEETEEGVIIPNF